VAIEALLAFFFESTFLELWIFGWDRLPPKLHNACIWVAAALARAGPVAVSTVLLPAAGLVLAATRDPGGAAAPKAPAVALALSRREDRAIAPRRGELAAATVELLHGVAELAAFGAADRALADVAEKKRAVGSATVRSGYARRAGAAVWDAVFFAVPAARGGTLAAVLVGVVVLTQLARAPGRVRPLRAGFGRPDPSRGGRPPAFIGV
jgi:Cytochrome bd terminal oxidase subunit I